MVEKFNQMIRFVPVAEKNYEQTRMITIGEHSKIKNNSLLNGSYNNDYHSLPDGWGITGLFNKELDYFSKN